MTAERPSGPQGLSAELGYRLGDIARSLDAIGLARFEWELGGAAATSLRLGHREVFDAEIFMAKESFAKVSQAFTSEPTEGVFRAFDIDVMDDALVLRRSEDGEFVIFRLGNTLVDRGEMLDLGEAGTVAVQTEREVLGRYVYHRSSELTGRELFDMAAILGKRPMMEYDREIRSLLDLRYSSLSGRLANWRLQTGYEVMIEQNGDPLGQGGYGAVKKLLSAMTFGQNLAAHRSIAISTPLDTLTYADQLKASLEENHYPLPRETTNALRDDLYLHWTWNSNAIEGNTLTLAETRNLLNEGALPEGKKLREILEAVNHRAAISFLEQAVAEKRPFDDDLILGLHRSVMQGIDDGVAGRYRRGSVYINMATVQPPAGGEILERQMQSLKAWHDSPQAEDLHPIARAAELHTRFVAIHPFEDGNGRTARLLLNYELMRSGYYPAVVRNADRELYLDAIDRSVASGDYSMVHEVVAQAEAETILRYLRLTDHDHELTRNGSEIAPREPRLSPSEEQPEQASAPSFGPGM